MKKQNLVFSFLDNNESFEFCDGFSFVHDERLLDALKHKNYKKEEFSLVIKSFDNKRIDELFQLEISIKNIGYFLVNFPSDENAKDKYSSLFEEIETLKDDTYDKGKQLLKIEKVILILNKYNPIFSIFVGKNDTFAYLKECSKTIPLFPLLFPEIVEKVSIRVVEKTNKEKNNSNIGDCLKKIGKVFDIEKPIFTIDFLFDLLFSLFISFSFYTAVAFFYKDDLKGLIFVAQILFYGFCLGYSLYLFKYKDKRKEHKGEDIIISTYILVGTALGNFISYVVTTYLLKMEGIPLLIIPLVFSFVICLGILPLLKLIYNLIQKKKLK